MGDDKGSGRRSSGTFGGFTAATLLGAAAAGGARFGLDEPWERSLAAGAAVWLLVFLTHLVSARRAASYPVTGGRITEGPTTAETVAPAESVQWLRRARAAASRLDGFRATGERDDGTTPGFASVLAEAAAHAQAAAEQLSSRVEAIAAIDAATDGSADHRELRVEQGRLEREAAALPEGLLRRAKEESARAVADRARARKRMEELRQVHMATLESIGLGLEAAAEHAGMLVSAHAASEAAAEMMDLTPLTRELEAVQAGLDHLEQVTRSLVTGTDPEPEPA
ncbi:hypothetical protein GCM10009716_34040 [Streptomyces sodiiphilus]|uniref:Uncharacterized protein n=1 Tax=Streptomyces sodiiphilus TaxID=226217 RepID=A0ABP5AYA9_9ACTN